MTDKDSLRRRIREELSRLPETVIPIASAALCDQIAASPVFQQARVIALFHPTATEPDLRPLLHFPHKIFLLPLCHPDRSLTWHRPDHPSQWKPSRFGIMEPDPIFDPAISDPVMDLVLVPGLAFTPRGDRLGHGAGYYDRFLAALPSSITTIGICFDCQLLEALPVQPHDIRVSQVLHA